MGNSDYHRSDEISVLKQELRHLKELVATASDADLTVVELLLRENRRLGPDPQNPGYVPTWIDLPQENGRVAFYWLDLVSSHLHWLHGSNRLYGLEGGVMPSTLEQWLSRIVPKDRARVERTLQDACEKGTSLDHQFRIATPDSNAIRWILDRASVQTDSQGNSVRIVGVHIDVTAMLEAQRSLEASEIRFRRTFEQANVGVAHVSANGRFVRCNDCLCRMLGREKHELASLTFQDITHPEDLETDLALVERLLDGEIDSYTMEKRYLRPDGEIIWTDLNVSLLRDSDGQPLIFVSVITDINERKKAQDQVQLLLGEADHRIKNLLTVVGAIVKSSARTAESTSELAEHLSRRLSGIAASHDLLLNKTDSGAELSQLIRKQLDIFADVSADRVVLDGVAFQLAPPAVHAFGMVLHELATNACKYGALSIDGGQVRVAWSIDEADDVLRFEWLERGGPAVIASPKQGFGSRILQRMLSGPLHGDTSFDLEPEGVRFTAHMPVKSIADEAMASLPRAPN